MNRQAKRTKVTGNRQEVERGAEQILPQDVREEPTLPTPRFQTLGIQNCQKTISTVLNHAICGNLLWQAYKKISKRQTCDQKELAVEKVNSVLASPVPTCSITSDIKSALLPSSLLQSPILVITPEFPVCYEKIKP